MFEFVRIQYDVQTFGTIWSIFLKRPKNDIESTKIFYKHKGWLRVPFVKKSHPSFHPMHTSFSQAMYIQLSSTFASSLAHAQSFWESRTSRITRPYSIHILRQMTHHIRLILEYDTSIHSYNSATRHHREFLADTSRYLFSPGNSHHRSCPTLL